MLSIGSTERTTTGFPTISRGWSHSCVIPISRCPRPSAHIISVAEGKNETIRWAESIAVTTPSRQPRQLLSVGGQQVAKPEGIATELLADGELYRIAEGGPIKNKGVKLPILPARIDLRRELREKLLVDQPPEKRRVEPGRVDAHNDSLEPQADEFADQRGRVAFP